MALTKEDLVAIGDVLKQQGPDAAIVATLADLKTQMALVKQTVTDNHDLAKSLDHRIRGNGVPGIETRLDRVEQRWKTVAFLLAPVYAGLVTIVFKVWT